MVKNPTSGGWRVPRPRSHQTAIRGALSVAIASLALVSPALADTTTRADATGAAEAIAGVAAATAGDVAHTTSSVDTALASDSSKAHVTVSRDPTDGVTIASADGAGAFSIGVPNADQSADARRAGPDLAIFSSDQASTATGISATSDGARLSVVITAADAPTDYAFPVQLPDGGYLKVLDDGSVDVVTGLGVTVASIATPFATDANGNGVPTHFEIDADGALVQHVDHAGAAYPVVADPRVSFHWDHATVYLSRSETRYVGHGGAWAIGGAVGAAIGVVGGAPGWIIGGAAVGGLMASIGADRVDSHLSHNQCIQINARWFGWPWDIGIDYSWYKC